VKKTKNYSRTFFSAAVLQEASEVFDGIAKSVGKLDPIPNHLSIGLPEYEWEYDSPEEFFADYPRAVHFIFMKLQSVRASGAEIDYKLCVSMSGHEFNIRVSVEAPERAQIERVFAVFEKSAADSRLPDPVDNDADMATPTIFIGHGHGEAWRDLKDHLHEQHGYRVQAYETGARAGHEIRDILQEIMSKSALALLVLTCDDDLGEGKFRARQNVIHETGLFQGRLGFARAIVLMEEGVEEFSNIAGIHQIRFSNGGIRETFGDVLATIRREFKQAK